MSWQVDESGDGVDPSLPEVSEAELFARLVDLGQLDREKYRKIREAAWLAIERKGARSEFPSESS